MSVTVKYLTFTCFNVTYFTPIIIDALIDFHKIAAFILTNSVDSCIILDTEEMVTEKMSSDNSTATKAAMLALIQTLRAVRASSIFKLTYILNIIAILKTINAVKKTLSQFTTQRDELLYKEFLDDLFRKRHPEAVWFSDAYDYANTNYLIPTQKEQNRDLLPSEYAGARSMMIDYLTRQFSAVTMGLDIDFLIALSGELQEQRSAENLSLCLLPSEKRFNRHKSMAKIAFADDDKRPLCHDYVHGVRKQLDLARDGGLAVCKCAKDDMFYTVGILDHRAVSGYPRIVLKKHLEWEFHMPSRNKIPSCRLRYKQGTFMMPLLNLTEAQKDAICKNLTRMGYDDSETAASTIAELLPAIGACNHGAVVIFLEETLAKQESHRLTLSGRGYELSPKRPLFHCEKPNEALVKRIASIDGAILADFKGNCYAYGVILDGKAVSDGNDSKDSKDNNDNKGNKDRGARYNSTKTYLNSILETFNSADEPKSRSTELARIGIVRSEDGMMDVFP